MGVGGLKGVGGRNGRGALGGGSVDPVGTMGVEGRKSTLRVETFGYGVGGGTSIAVEKKCFPSRGNFSSALPLSVFVLIEVFNPQVKETVYVCGL